MYYICIMVRDKNIVVRVTKEELEIIRNKCKNKSISISSYLRMLALEK